MKPVKYSRSTLAMHALQQHPAGIMLCISQIHCHVSHVASHGVTNIMHMQKPH